MKNQRPAAILFDLDGTLIDSIGLLLECVRHTFAGQKRVPTDEQWIAGIGTPLPKQLADFTDAAEDIAALTDRYRSFQREHHDRLTAAYDGVEQTLSLLAERGHPMGVVTSKSNEMMLRGLRHTGIERFMTTFIGCDSCHIHKPDPYPVRLALKELGYEPDDALFVGDSPHDIQSGNAAGVTTVAALWGPFTREQLEPHNPSFYLEKISGLPGLVDRLKPLAKPTSKITDPSGQRHSQ
jgi:pyrophosphatase PpaX